MVEPTVMEIRQLKNFGHVVKYIRCDNAGENKLLEASLKPDPIVMEYTAANTPQQNSIVERAFPTLQQEQKR